MLSVDCIKLDLEARRKKKAVIELVDLLAGAGKIKNPAELADEILERENLASTGIGHGIGLPHCLTGLLDKTVIAFGRSEGGIPFDAADNRPVHLIFLMAGPKSATALHLQILSKLSRLLTEKDFREKLLQAKSPEEVIELFRQGEKV
jgi:fructose-specific phosphotransferase system IIA component